MLRVNTRINKQTLQTRTACAMAIGTNAPNSKIYQNDPTLQDMATKVTAAGDALSKADAKVKSLMLELAAARADRESLTDAFDTAYELYVTKVETVAATPKDMNDLALTPQVQSSHQLVTPLSITAKYDLKKSIIQVAVKEAAGSQACIIEISPDPAGPATWKRVEGVGTSRTLGGYAPGVYWVRAASARANEQSAFTEPVSVTVK
jgi:hypothetical protein